MGEVRYKAWGEERYTNGTTPTTYRYTGQRAEAGIGLYFYNARWYDPALGRFVQADTVVPDPGNPQNLNRYSYVSNRPIIATDPTGHDLMIVGGVEGDMDPALWKEWIMAYKGWSESEWDIFYQQWYHAGTFTAKNAVLSAQSIGIFTWGGRTLEEAKTYAAQSTTGDMVKQLAAEMAGMQDVTLIGLSKAMR